MSEISHSLYICIPTGFSPGPIPPMSLWALLNQWGLTNHECALDLRLGLNAYWEFDGGPPTSCIADVTGLETVKNRKTRLLRHPRQGISNKRGENCRRSISVSFYNSKFHSSEPIPQAIYFNLNQSFSSPLLQSHFRALWRGWAMCPYVIILMKAIRAW